MPFDKKYTKIVTHFDLDGVASASLLALIYEDINSYYFAGPSQVDRLSYDEETIVADLPHPYPKECGLWFDHHVANIEELSALGIDHKKLPGIIEEQPSCMRVIYNHFSQYFEIDFLEDFVNEVDIIDSFAYNSFVEWQKITPAKNIDHAIKLDFRDGGFLRHLVVQLRDNDYLDVANSKEVLERAEKFRKNEDAQLPLIEKLSKPLDDKGDIILIDLTSVKNPPAIEKNLTYKFYPDAKAALTVRSIYQRGQKTNGLSISISLGFVDNEIKNKVDFGDMMREMEIGSGHPGAAAGRFECKSKAEREKREKEVLDTILKMWNEQLGR